MASFDVVSLFTAIQVQKACAYIRNKLEDDDTLQSRTNLTTDEWQMLSRCWNLFFLTVFSSIMIVFINKHMVVPWEARLVLSSPTFVWRLSKNQPYRPWEFPQNLEKIRWWQFCHHQDYVPEFHDKLNSIDPMISFTIQKESNQQISFLDTLVSRKNGFIVIYVFRKPTHTDRYLNFNSHHEKKHKISTERFWFVCMPRGRGVLNRV